MGTRLVRERVAIRPPEKCPGAPITTNDPEGKMMKRITLCMLTMPALLAVLANNSYAQSFYDVNTIQTIAITFKQSNWDYMLDTAKAGSDGYIMAQSVTVNGVRYDSVGVKYKGNSTYSPGQVKNPFHIELDTYKDQDYQGYTDIKLSNAAKDPSFIREVLSYAILRRYMDAPLSNYANVYVNGALLGLYANCESIGKKFVNNHFYSKTNAFFKCNPLDGAGPGTTALPNLVYWGPDSASYVKAYEMNSDYGWSDLIKLCYTLNNNVNAIETVLDVDRALWMIAFDNVLVNLDSYIGVFAQNYYLYKDNTGRFNVVLWDFNESFGTFNSTGTISLPNTTAKMQMTHMLHASDANWPLVQKLLAIPMYRRMYLAHMHTILTENFSNGSYLTTAQSLQPIISAAVQADPYKFFTYAQFQTNLTTDVTSGGGGPGTTSAPGITNLMSGRVTYLSALSDFTAAKPVISNVTPSDANPQLNSSVFVIADVVNANANAVYLGYRYGVAEKFNRVPMYDDGAHGDGASGNSVYGASIVVSGPTVQYYIYAENSSAGEFSPVRAEHEFHTLKAAASTGGEIVMNEIYARGTTADPDWVEIHNSSSAAMDISGYRIYDAGAQGGTKAKKEFPAGTVVPAKGVVVIVTDDTTSSGFGLSNSGEKVWLENASGVIIDTVTFLGHTATQSYGRIPDGGVWQLLNTITRGKSNGSATDAQDGSSSVRGFGLNQNYPNPFNPTTMIQYTLPSRSYVTLSVFNTLGQIVRELVNGDRDAGIQRVRFDASGLSSGVYFYRLRAGDFVSTRRLLLLQ
jgi:hypothetical protein